MNGLNMTLQRARNSLTYRLPRLSSDIRRAYLTARYGFPVIATSWAPSEAEDIITEYCWMPPLVPGFPQHDDLGLLLHLVRRLQPTRVLEFGTAEGNTVANICKQLPSVEVVTVNALPHQISGTYVTEVLDREDIGKVYRKHGFSTRVQQIFSDTMELALDEYVASESFDLAIIDACHDSRYVENDFLMVREFIRDGAVVLLHDTHPKGAGHLIGSCLACLQLRRQGFDIQHVDGTWWAIWRKNKDVASLLNGDSVTEPNFRE